MTAREAPLDRLERACRTVTAGVLAAVLGRRDPATLDQWLRQRPAPRRWAIIGGTLGLLLLLALVMAQFGWIGLALYFAAVVALIR